MVELISVIVPVYNVEPYLDKCINSIVNQSYSNLEIILVDDGSTDKSSVMCDEWAQKDSRIIVIHKENGGQSSARNTGLDICKGDYISFVDSDDYIEKDMILELYNALKISNAGVSICQYKNVTSDGEIVARGLNKSIKVNSNTVISAEEYLTQLLQGQAISVIWGKLYNKDSIANFCFLVGIYSEDTMFLYQLIEPKMQFAIVPNIGYNYVLRDSSTTQGTEKNKFYLDGVKVSFLIEDIINNKFNGMKDYIILNQMRCIISFLIGIPYSYIDNNNPSYMFVLDKIKENKMGFYLSRTPLKFKGFVFLFLVMKKFTKFMAEIALKVSINLTFMSRKKKL